MTEYKVAAYGLRKTVKDAKRRVEANFIMGDPAQVWKGLRIMTDFKNKPSLVSSANQLAPVYTTVFNTSLAQAVVPSCFKQSVIIPVPKRRIPSCMNDYHPVALTSAVMKCFEKLIKNYISTSLPSSFDTLQFAHRANRSRDDAIPNLLHTTLTHLDEGRGNYVRMLFIDYSSAFNTIVPPPLDPEDEVAGNQHPNMQLGAQLPH